MRILGRTTRQGPLTESDYLMVADLLRQYDIRFKVNTVVSSVNWQEDLTGFIAQVRPERCREFLDWATLSIDTVDEDKMRILGRTTRQGPLTESDYLMVADLLRQYDIRFKVNTVVSSVNWQEDLTGFIAQVRRRRNDGSCSRSFPSWGRTTRKSTDSS